MFNFLLASNNYGKALHDLNDIEKVEVSHRERIVNKIINTAINFY